MNECRKQNNSPIDDDQQQKKEGEDCTHKECQRTVKIDEGINEFNFALLLHHHYLYFIFRNTITNSIHYL